MGAHLCRLAPSLAEDRAVRLAASVSCAASPPSGSAADAKDLRDRPAHALCHSKLTWTQRMCQQDCILACQPPASY